MGGEGEPKYQSGEVQTIMLGLLRENRDDTKHIIGRLGGIEAEAKATKDQLVNGHDRMNRFESRLVAVEQREPTPPPRKHDQRDIQTDVIKRPSKLDLAMWIKIGTLIGAVLAGLAASKAVP